MITPKMCRCLPLFVEREMLMIKINLGVEKVRTILPMMLGGGVVLIGSLILVVDAVVEQPVRDHPLVFAFDDLAIRSEDTPPTIAVGVGLRQFVPRADVSTKNGAEQVPIVAE